MPAQECGHHRPRRAQHDVGHLLARRGAAALRKLEVGHQHARQPGAVHGAVEVVAIGAAPCLQPELRQHRLLEEVQQRFVLGRQVDAPAVRGLDVAVAGQLAQDLGQVGVERERAARQVVGAAQRQRQSRVGLDRLPLERTGLQPLRMLRRHAQLAVAALPLQEGMQRDAVTRADFSQPRPGGDVVVDGGGFGGEDPPAAADLHLLPDAQGLQLDPFAADEYLVVGAAVQQVAVARGDAHARLAGVAEPVDDAVAVFHPAVELRLDQLLRRQQAAVGDDEGVTGDAGPTFVHDLGLALRVEVLRDLAHDAHELALPGLEQRRVLLDEVEQVLLRLGREALAGGSGGVLVGARRQGAPQIVDLLLGVGLALAPSAQLLRQALAAGAAVAVDAVVGQRVAGVEVLLDLGQAVALLAFGDVVLGVDEVVDDRRRVGPHAKQVVALEEAVVAVGGVGDDQGLHRQRVLLHQVGDAGVAVDDDLVGQPHVAALVVALGGDELLAVAPVAVVDRHADAGVGVHHLLGGDDLELVGVGVEPVALGGGADDLVVALDELEAPVAGPGQRLRRARRRRPRRLQRQRGATPVARRRDARGVQAAAALDARVGHDGFRPRPAPS